MTATWPALPYHAWEPTKQTLHRYVQMVGKLRMALVPFRNHWWHVTLYVSAHGLTTGPMPAGDRSVEVELDFVEHRLRVRTSRGDEAGFALRDRLPCAVFHRDLSAALHEVGVDAEPGREPFDLGDSPPFAEDMEHDSYDADAVERFWDILRRTDAVFAEFASRFNGKASPTHVFWHGFDLAHGRFSGRRAPAREGVDRVTAEAYSHEIISFGWWPGDDKRTPFPAFYSYTAPEPDGLSAQPLEPAEAAWQDTGNGSLAILPYDAVRSAADPAGTLLAFLESAYRAGATTAGWDREAFATSHAPA
jgi:Family of unknown function (DUF5996)